MNMILEYFFVYITASNRVRVCLTRSMCATCYNREKLFCQSLAKLKEDVVKANTLVREANFLVQEMAKPMEFSVTLQIPAANLSPNRRVIFA
jgi:hypothetical protein